MIGGISSADVNTDLWNYSILGNNISATFALPVNGAPDMSAYTGQGAGWTVDLLTIGTEALLGSTTVFANLSDVLYILAWNTPTILEGTQGFYRITSTDTFATLDSVFYTFQQAEAPLGGTDLDVTNSSFDFSSSTWQVVPEPATALLFGIGGIGAFIVRRNKKKAQEEADA